MPDPFDTSRIHDASSYDKGPSGMNRNYHYQVEITYTDKQGLQRTQFVTISTNSVLNEGDVLSRAEGLAKGVGNSGIAGEIDDIQIVGALRSPALGE